MGFPGAAGQLDAGGESRAHLSHPRRAAVLEVIFSCSQSWARAILLLMTVLDAQALTSVESDHNDSIT
jgi:hypothetical protein